MIKLVPKLVILTNGEKIISMLGELTDDNGEKLCLISKCPLVLTMNTTEETVDSKPQYILNFTKWVPFSDELEFKIAYSSVTTICDVSEEVLKVYIERYGEYLDLEENQEVSEVNELTN
jgi:hypothetical protein